MGSILGYTVGVGDMAGLTFTSIIGLIIAGTWLAVGPSPITQLPA